MALVHEATDTNKSQRVICCRSFHVQDFPEADPQPDWGCKGLTTDDPYYANSSISGMQAITADALRDEGNYVLYAVNAETNAVETYVDVVNWPGLKSKRYPVNLEAESIILLGYLPANKSLNMQVVNASQSRNYYVKMKCVIDPDDLAAVIQPKTNAVYTSFEFGNDNLRWHTLTFLNNMSVSKNCRQLSLKAGGFKAKVNCRKGVVNLQGIAKQYLQDYNNVRFFMNINGYSDVDFIWFDHQRKYNWNREYKPHYK
ncbi:hypothetical protein IKW72_05460 [bacterium]|nr:hypothetical protein [bacterium]